MKNPFASKDLSEPTRRRVELAIAVAQERLLSTHVDHALRLIDLVGDQVPFEDALGIYTRLLRLTDDESRNITTRALAIIGERAVEGETWPEPAAPVEVEAPQEGTGRGFLRQIRQRLRGRVNEDLRRWVELAAARTEVALLETHVENALNFVEMLEKELPFTEAVELYLEALDVRDSIAEVAYFMTLTRLADEILPRAGAAAERNAGVRAAAEERRLRVVDKDGG
ncbi:MAG: hypothetical protein IRZ00_09045 [Gemmatimonadetes bacterium]|nr:hypothetical protein [Gemmatimonadota bacterium]